jgi:hypothetical protein
LVALTIGAVMLGRAQHPGQRDLRRGCRMADGYRIERV